MQIRIKFKPFIMEAATKTALENRIKERFMASWVAGAGYGLRTWTNERMGNDHWVLVNYEKHRRKVKQVRLARAHTKTIQLTPGGVATKVKQKHMTTQVKPAFWRAFVYKFPQKMVKTCNQKARNFTIELDVL